MSRILIVDDTRTDLDAMRQGAQETIESSGVGIVDAAEDVSTAIKLLTENHFDVVVVDLQLTPDKKKEGWDVLQYARKLHSDTRVIIATAYQEPEVEMRSIALGAFGYMNKLQDDLIEQTRKIVLDALHAT